MHPPRLRLVLLALPIVVTACYAPEPRQLNGIGYNDKIRVDDLAPLTPEDYAASVDYGPLRDGISPDGTGFVAEVLPLSGSWHEGSASKLASSDCLWFASGGAASPNRERLALTWEVFIDYDGELQDVPGVRIQRTACTFSHPHDRLEVSTAGDELPLAGDDVPWLPAIPAVIGVDARETGETTTVVSRRVPQEIFGTTLAELHNGTGEARFWRCPGEDEKPDVDHSFDGDPANDFLSGRFDGPFARAIVTGVNDFACPSDPDRGIVGSCALRCGIVAEDDATYSLDAGLHSLRPNVMVALPGREIARQSQKLSGGVYRWATGVKRNGGNETQVRWHENFSPRVRVSQVEFFACQGPYGPGCGELPLATIADRLLVRQRLNDGSETVWICRGSQPVPGRTVVEISLDTCTSDTAGGPPAFTPTYAVNVLAGMSESDYLRAPLEWEFGINGLPNDVLPALRFTLEPDFTQPGRMRLSSSALDFGDVPIDTRAESAVAVSNVGGQGMQIDEIALENGDVDSFEAMVLVAPIAVQLPIDLRPSAGKLDVVAHPELADMELFELTRDATGEVLLVHPTRQEGRSLNLDGLAVTVGPGGVLLRDDPSATYTAPLPPAGVERPVHVLTHVPATFPLAVASGDEVVIRTWARPRGSATRTAELAVYVSRPGVVNSRQRLVTRLEVVGLLHPELLALPERLFFGRCHGECTPGDPRPRRRVVLANIGQGELERFDFELQDGDASRFELVSSHEPTATLEPGRSEIVELTYRPECIATYPHHRARLIVHHAYGQETIELEGDSYLACNP